MRAYNKQSGFTIFELVIVISISGIIAGLSTVIIGRYLDSYVALERREKLQTSIRFVVERISREVRHALPYSICIPPIDDNKCAKNGTQFYFIPIKDSGRYYQGAGGGGEPLPTGNQTDTVLESISTGRAHFLNAAPDDWVVVYNLDEVKIYNVPALTNSERHQILSIAPATTNDSELITFKNTVSFASDSPVRRFHIIGNNTNAVTLFYLEGTNLYRKTTTFADPLDGTASATRRLLMENVIACSFTYGSGSLKKAGLFRIDITVGIDNEKIQVVHNAHVNNIP